MHTLTIQMKFTFGDRVRFDSRLQGCSGTGTVEGIMVNRDGQVDYIIEMDQSEDGDLQPGILEEEMILLNSLEEG